MPRYQADIEVTYQDVLSLEVEAEDEDQAKTLLEKEAQEGYMTLAPEDLEYGLCSEIECLDEEMPDPEG